MRRHKGVGMVHKFGHMQWRLFWLRLRSPANTQALSVYVVVRKTLVIAAFPVRHIIQPFLASSPSFMSQPFLCRFPVCIYLDNCPKQTKVCRQIMKSLICLTAVTVLFKLLGWFLGMVMEVLTSDQTFVLDGLRGKADWLGAKLVAFRIFSTVMMTTGPGDEKAFVGAEQQVSVLSSKVSLG